MAPKNLYLDKRWLTFRQKCLERVGFKCERCSREGILQVHHPEYEKGHAPWEYEPEFCEVLCRACHAEEHGHILPRSGWVIVHSDLDDGEPSDPIECVNCGTEIRWHFTLYHPDYGEAVVGSECAENLSLGPEMTKLKSYYRRRQTFAFSPRWKVVEWGWWRWAGAYIMAVYPVAGGFGLQIGEKKGKETFASVVEAKARAFEVVENRLRSKEERAQKEQERRRTPKYEDDDTP